MLLDKQNMMINSGVVNGLGATTTYTADPLGGTPFPVTAGGSIGSIDLGLSGLLPRRATALTLLALISGGTVAGTASLQFSIYNSATAGAATNLVAQSGVIAAATMIAGYEIPIEIPDSVKLSLRYLVATILTGAGAATGTAIIDLGLVPDGDRQTANI